MDANECENDERGCEQNRDEECDERDLNRVCSAGESDAGDAAGDRSDVGERCEDLHDEGDGGGGFCDANERRRGGVAGNGAGGDERCVSKEVAEEGRDERRCDDDERDAEDDA